MQQICLFLKEHCSQRWYIGDSGEIDLKNPLVESLFNRLDDLNRSKEIPEKYILNYNMLKYTI